MSGESTISAASDDSMSKSRFSADWTGLRRTLR